MKLFYCPKCADILALRNTIRTCVCGSSWGKYLPDEYHARLGGQAIPIGIRNSSFFSAVICRPEEGKGSEFTAFVIPKDCDVVQYECSLITHAEDEEEYSIDDGICTCPHCQQGEYMPGRGEKYCFYCQNAIDMYGELP